MHRRGYLSTQHCALKPTVTCPAFIACTESCTQYIISQTLFRLIGEPLSILHKMNLYSNINLESAPQLGALRNIQQQQQKRTERTNNYWELRFASKSQNTFNYKHRTYNTQKKITPLFIYFNFLNVFFFSA